MKGVGNSYGFARVSTIGKQIEDGARASDASGIDALISDYAVYLERVVIVYE